MDIICAGCGKHFSSIESVREHNGICKGNNLKMGGDTSPITASKHDVIKCKSCGLITLVEVSKNWYKCENPNCGAYGSTPDSVTRIDIIWVQKPTQPLKLDHKSDCACAACTYARLTRH